MAQSVFFLLIASLFAAHAARIRMHSQKNVAKQSTIPGNEMWTLVTYDGSSCPLTCGGFPLEELKREIDIIPPPDGCADKKQTMPECPVEGGNVSQAGGHAGSFHVLSGNRVAKISEAFERTAEAKHRFRGEVELQAYMEMWCLSRLKEHPAGAEMAEVKTHPLLGFVDERKLAPEAFGMCRVQSKVYIVMENVMASFVDPCILDLKLGYQTAEPNEIEDLSNAGMMSFGKKAKLMGVRQMAREKSHKTPGVRMAGAKITSAFTGSAWKLAKMDPRPNNFMARALGDPGHKFDKALIQGLLTRNEEMRALWEASGDNFRSVGLSSLMVHECGAVGKSLVIEGLHFDEEGPAFSVEPLGSGNHSVVVHEVTAGIRIYPEESIVANNPKEYLSSMFKDYYLATEKIAMSSHPAWSTSFGLRHQRSVDVSLAPPVEKLEVVVMGKGWSEPLGGDQRQYVKVAKLGTLEVAGPLEDGRHCGDLETKDKQSPAPRVCFDLRTSSDDTVPKMPLMKLIDFAHFYPKTSRRGGQWGRNSDGVGKGLETISKELAKYL